MLRTQWIQVSVLLWHGYCWWHKDLATRCAAFFKEPNICHWLSVWAPCSLRHIPFSSKRQQSQECQRNLFPVLWGSVLFLLLGKQLRVWAHTRLLSEKSISFQVFPLPTSVEVAGGGGDPATYLATWILNCVWPTSVTRPTEAVLYLKETAQRRCFLLILIQIPMKLDNQTTQLNSPFMPLLHASQHYALGCHWENIYEKVKCLRFNWNCCWPYHLLLCSQWLMASQRGEG